MKTRPAILSLAAFGLLILSAWHFASPMILPPESQYLGIGLFITCVAMAVWTFNASRLMLLLTPAFLAGTFLSSWQIISQRPDSVMTSFLAVAFYGLSLLVIAAIFSFRDVRRLFVNPELRWWLTPFRRKIRLHLQMKLFNGSEEIDARTYDLSDRGAFIPLQSAVFRDSVLKNLNVDTRCLIRLSLGHFRHLDCSAKIVRYATGQGAYPAGFGLQFLNLNRKQQRYLSDYIRTV